MNENNFNASLDLIKDHFPITLRKLFQTNLKYFFDLVEEMQKTYDAKGNSWKQNIDFMTFVPITKLLTAHNPDKYVQYLSEIDSINIYNYDSYSVKQKSKYSDEKSKPFIFNVIFRKIVSPGSQLDLMSSREYLVKFVNVYSRAEDENKAELKDYDYKDIFESYVPPIVSYLKCDGLVYHTDRKDYRRVVDSEKNKNGDNLEVYETLRFEHEENVDTYNPIHDAFGSPLKVSKNCDLSVTCEIDYDTIFDFTINSLLSYTKHNINRKFKEKILEIRKTRKNEGFFEWYVVLKEIFANDPSACNEFLDLLLNIVEKPWTLSIFMTYYPIDEKINKIFDTIPKLIAENLLKVENRFLDKIYLNDDNDRSDVNVVLNGLRASSIIDITTLIKTVLNGSYRTTSENSSISNTLMSYIAELIKLLSSTDNYSKIPLDNSKPDKKVNLFIKGFFENIELDESNLNFCRNTMLEFKNNFNYMVRPLEMLEIDDVYTKRAKIIKNLRVSIILFGHLLLTNYYIYNQMTNFKTTLSNVRSIDYKTSLKRIRNIIKRNLNDLIYLVYRESEKDYSDTGEYSSGYMYISNSIIDGINPNNIKSVLSSSSSRYSVALNNLYTRKNNNKSSEKPIIDIDGVSTKMGESNYCIFDQYSFYMSIFSQNNLFDKDNLIHVVVSILNKYYEIHGKEVDSQYFTNGVLIAARNEFKPIVGFTLHQKESNLPFMFHYITKLYKWMKHEELDLGFQILLSNLKDKEYSNYPLSGEKIADLKEKNGDFKSTDIELFDQMKKEYMELTNRMAPVSMNAGETSVESLRKDLEFIIDRSKEDMFGIFQDPFCMRYNSNVVATMHSLAQDNPDNFLSKESKEAFVKEKLDFIHFCRDEYCEPMSNFLKK